MTNLKNLVRFNSDSLPIYNRALQKKHDDDLKARLAPIFGLITTAYKLYDDRFQTNRLESIPQQAHFLPYLNDLKSLYSYKNATIRFVKKTIDDLQTFPLGNTCQNCTINAVNSMDHVLGQAGFPQYAVHPANLFPSCTECNGYKSDSFTRHGLRRFLNLYSDILPNIQYLFVNIAVDASGDLDYNFVVENRNGLGGNLFALIDNHFRELNLISRMKSASIKPFSELRSSIRARLKDLTWEKISEQVQTETQENMQNLGTNHFQYVLQRAMMAHPLFQNSFPQVIAPA